MELFLETIKTLAPSQGFYGRLLAQVEELKEEDTVGYEKLTEEMNKQNFTDTLDVIFFLES